MIGRVNPNQIMLLLILMVPIYAVNQKLVFEILKGLDTGGLLRTICMQQRLTLQPSQGYGRAEKVSASLRHGLHFA